MTNTKTLIVTFSLLLTVAMCAITKIPCVQNPTYTSVNDVPQIFVTVNELYVVPQKEIVSGAQLSASVSSQSPNITFNNGVVYNQNISINTSEVSLVQWIPSVQMDSNGLSQFPSLLSQNSSLYLSVLSAVPGSASGTFQTSDITSVFESTNFTWVNDADPTNITNISQTLEWNMTQCLSSMQLTSELYSMSCVYNSGTNGTLNYTNVLFLVNITDSNSSTAAMGQHYDDKHYMFGDVVPYSNYQEILTDTANNNSYYIFVVAPAVEFANVSALPNGTAVNIYHLNTTVYTNNETNQTVYAETKYFATITAEFINSLSNGTEFPNNLTTLNIELLVAFENQIVIFDKTYGYMQMQVDFTNMSVSWVQYQNLTTFNLDSTVTGFTIGLNDDVSPYSGNIEIYITSLYTLYVFEQTNGMGSNFTLSESYPLVVATTNQNQIWSNQDYLYVINMETLYVYNRGWGENVTNIQYTQSGVVAGQLFQNNQFIALNFPSLILQSYTLSEPTFTWNSNLPKQEYQTTFTFSSDIGSDCKNPSYISSSYVATTPQVITLENMNISTALANFQPVELNDYFVGPNINFNINGTSGIITPVIQNPFSNLTLNQSFETGIKNTAAVVNPNNENQFAWFQFLQNGNYTTQNCSNTLNNGYMNINCGAPVLQADNLTQIFGNANDQVVLVLASNNTGCLLMYNGLSCYDTIMPTLENITFADMDGDCGYFVGMMKTGNTSVPAVEIKCANAPANYSMIITNNTLNMTETDFTPVKVQTRGQYMFLQLDTQVIQFYYNSWYHQYVIDSTLSISAGSAMFLNEEDGRVVIANSQGVTVYSTTVTVGTFQTLYTINNAILSQSGYNFTNTSVWIQAPSGCLYTIGNSSDSKSALITLKPFEDQISSIYSVFPTNQTSDETIQLLVVSSGEADLVINTKTLTDATPVIMMVPFELSLQFSTNQSLINAMVVKTNLNLAVNSFTTNQFTNTYAARVVYPQYLNNLTVNTAQIEQMLKNELSYNQNGGVKPITLNNTAFFSGNMLGYTVNCQSNDTVCQEGIAVQNMLQNSPTNFSAMLQNQSQSQVLAVLQSSAQQLTLLTIASNSTENITNFALFGFNMQTETFQNMANFTYNVTDVNIACGNLQAANLNASGDFLGPNLIVVCTVMPKNTSLPSYTELLQFAWMNVTKPVPVNASETKFLAVTDNTTTNVTVQEWVQYTGSLNATGALSEVQIIANTTGNFIQAIGMGLNGAVQNLMFYNVSLLVSNQSVISSYKQIAYPDLFNDRQTTAYLAGYNGLAYPGQYSLSVFFQNQQNISIVYEDLVEGKYAFATSGIIDLQQLSLSSYYVLDSDTNFTQVMWVQGLQENVTSLLVVSQGQPIYEFTFNLTTFLANPTNASTYLTYCSTYKQYGTFNIGMVSVGGTNNNYIVGYFTNGTQSNFALWNRQPNSFNAIVSGYQVPSDVNVTGGFMWLDVFSSVSSSSVPMPNAALLYMPSNMSDLYVFEQYNQPSLLLNDKLNTTTQFSLGFITDYPSNGTNTSVTLTVGYVPEPQPDNGDDDKKFPTWGIIVICVVGGVIVLGAIGYFIYRKKQSSGGYQEMSGLKEPMKA